MWPRRGVRAGDRTFNHRTAVNIHEYQAKELLADVPRFASTPEIRVDCPDDVKFPLVERAVAHFRATREVIDVDGARVLFGDGWGLIRASNTQPVLVMRFEARTEERVAEIRAEMEGWLATQGVATAGTRAH